MNTSAFKGNILLPFFFLLSILISCSEEFSENREIDRDENTSLTIYIPNLEYNTRDGETKKVDATDDEKTLNNLILYLFSDDVEKSLYRKITLKEYESESEKSGYQTYEVKNLDPGEYYVAVTANIEYYINEIETPLEIKQKSDLENLVLTFDSEKKIEAKNLPMVWFSDDPENDSQTSDGKITIEDNTVIESTLTFLCAKVRLTVLFYNPEGKMILKQGMDELQARVYYVGKETKIKKEVEDNKVSEILSTDDSNDVWSFILKKYEYPGESYPFSTSTEQPDDDLYRNSNIEETKFAWQGIIYIPENLSQSYTTFSLISPIENKDEYSTGIHTVEGEKSIVERGMMYDITLSLTAPEEEIIETNLYRIYWPAINGYGLYIYNGDQYTDSRDIERDDYWKKIMQLCEDQDPINNYFVYDFDFANYNYNNYSLCFNNLNKNTSINWTNASSSIPFNLKSDFQEIIEDNKKIYVGFIKSEDNIPKKVYPGDPFSHIIKEDNIDFYWNKNNVTFNDTPYEYINISNGDWNLEINLPSYIEQIFRNGKSKGEYFNLLFRYNHDRMIDFFKYIFATNQYGSNPSIERIITLSDENVSLEVETSGGRTWTFKIEDLNDQ